MRFAKTTCIVQGNYLNEIIFGLINKLKKFSIFRAIFKYILITQLEALRRNETGILLMHNYDTAIESTNTIFARLCR